MKRLLVYIINDGEARYWSAQLCEARLHDKRVSVWCAVSRNHNVGSVGQYIVESTTESPIISMHH